jgi:hypothetical protein
MGSPPGIAGRSVAKWHRSRGMETAPWAARAIIVEDAGAGADDHIEPFGAG